MDKVPELVGGSADLTPSNNTQPKAFKNFSPDDFAARYVHYGIREHGMRPTLVSMIVRQGTSLIETLELARYSSTHLRGGPLSGGASEESILDVC